MKDKTTIYFFSGTGNSLKIVKDLADHLHTVKIISITDLLDSDDSIMIEGSKIGFVFPVYFARVPAVVETFIEQVSFGDTDYIFSVANGGGWFGRTLKIFEGLLKDKGQVMNAGFTIPMPGNHPQIARFNRTDHATYFSNEEKKVKDIANEIVQRTSGLVETNLGLLGYIMAYGLFLKPYRDSKEGRLDEVFWYKESCDRCGLCASICPVDNITMDNKGPVWKHNCVNCASCYHNCPKESIEFGKDTMQRYRHPEITIQDLLKAHHTG